jgi:hypothetical protein
MKLFVAFAALVAVVSGKKVAPAKTVELKDLQVDSPLGNKVMENARRLDQNAEEEIDFTWVANYAIKFQGCHHISQWNDEADGEEDVRIQTKRLVRFRLCPKDSCTTENAGGCASGYGEYILDMNIFLDAYLQTQQEHNEYMCEYYAYNNCQNQNGRRLDEDTCLWDYLESIGEDPYMCVDQNPYNDDEAEEEAFDFADYMECAEYKFENQNNRKLDQQEEEQFFMGPYCSDSGGAIYLGLFTDDQCTIFADDYGGKETYYTNSGGQTMPFHATSVIDYDCISCTEPEDFNNGGNDNQDADEVVEFCEQIYSQAGKCETELYSAGISNINENACNYMEGIKIVRKNGVVQQNSSKANKTASIFIGIFVVAFVLLAAYVYYLKTKLDRASINLAE